ncbi:MAG: serine/threonine protein kinase [Myxococcales bacterium]|nr:serine/threonine protein kinase [Myxococcales bacterium]
MTSETCSEGGWNALLSPSQALRGGRYRLISVLRVGGSGVVWRAIDTRDAVVAAIKAIPAESGGEAAVQHEAEAVTRVRHPGAMPVPATFVEAGYGFIVMDLAACSLGDLVEAHGPVPVPVALRVTITLCDVLAAAQKAGVVHRDVKPPNVLVMPDGTVRLADWGTPFPRSTWISRWAGMSARPASATSSATGSSTSSCRCSTTPPSLCSTALATGASASRSASSRILPHGISIWPTWRATARRTSSTPPGRSRRCTPLAPPRTRPMASQRSTCC